MKELQMMDAGSVLAETGEGFGSMIGCVKAELAEYGKVVETEDQGFLLDFSNAWRIRRISCTVEDAGSAGRTDSEDREVRRYAVTFKEGNASGWLRKVFFAVLLAALAILTFRCIFALAGLLFAAYWSIIPASSPRRVLSALKRRFS